MRKSGGGRGGPGGPGGKCICLSCGHKMSHKAGVPCIKEKCPKCGKTMVREGSSHHKVYLEKQSKKDK